MEREKSQILGVKDLHIVRMNLEIMSTVRYYQVGIISTNLVIILPFPLYTLNRIMDVF